MKLKIITVITVILLLVVMYVPVYAETPIPDPPAGAYSYWIVVLRPNDSVYLITSPNPITALDQGKYGIHLTTYASHKTYNLIDGNWSYDKEGKGHTSWPIEHVYASNHDIAYSDGSGFFFTLPKVSELCQIVRQMKNKGTFGTILRTFSAGLIPIIGLLILVISLRKGWEFLRGQLAN